MDLKTISIDDASALSEQALTANGVGPSHAKSITRTYIAAEIAEKRSHGLRLIPWILPQLAAATPLEISVPKETNNSILIDGGNLPGPPVLDSLVDRLLEKLNDNSIVIGAIRNAGHVGMLAHYAEPFIEKNIIAIICGTTPSVTVPLGGRDPVLGTNPICIAIPTDTDPIIFDAGTTAMTFHAVMQAKQTQSTLPQDVVLDKDGQPTINPEEADPTRLLPFGGHKGFGLTLMIEILTAGLTGWRIGASKAGRISNDFFSTSIIALPTNVFVDNDVYASGIRNFINDIARSQNSTTARIPYSKTLETIKRNRQRGSIELSETLLHELKKLSRGEK